jgi:sulfur transfer protein SufE
MAGKILAADNFSTPGDTIILNGIHLLIPDALSGDKPEIIEQVQVEWFWNAVAVIIDEEQELNEIIEALIARWRY